MMDLVIKKIFLFIFFSWLLFSKSFHLRVTVHNSPQRSQRTGMSDTGAHHCCAVSGRFVMMGAGKRCASYTFRLFLDSSFNFAFFLSPRPSDKRRDVIFLLHYVVVCRCGGRRDVVLLLHDDVVCRCGC